MSVKKTSKNRKNITSGVDVLKDIAKANKQVVTKPSKPVKWEVVLDDSQILIAERFVEVKSVSEKIEASLEASKNDLYPILQNFLIEKMWNTKSRPTNPLILIKRRDGSVDHQFQFILSDKFSISCPDNIEDRFQYFMGLLDQCGLSEDDSERLLENEVYFESVVGFKSLDVLTNGKLGEGRAWIESTQEEKIVGQKLATLMTWRGGYPLPEPLTEKENILLIDMSNKVQVKAGFLERVAQYCKTKEQLVLVLTIFKPTMYAIHVKFGLEQNDNKKNERQNKIAQRIINSSY